MAQNSNNKLLLIVAIVAFVVSLFAAIVTVSVDRLSTTGYVSQGDANLTISSSAAINFTTSSINWGTGQVYANTTVAYLTSNGNVTGGNWTTVTSGFVIENIGNNNVSLNLTVTKTAAQFIGGTGAGYGWNVTNVEAGSCLNSSGGTGNLDLVRWNDTSISGHLFCPRLQFANSADTVRVDINVTIPENAPTGAKGDTLTAIVTAV